MRCGLSSLFRMMTEEDSRGDPSFAEHIRAGEMLSSLLPHEHRNYPAAEKYYLQAFRKKPTNSKINHKLGNLYLAAPPQVIDVTQQFVL
jgi:hypothetical protein